MKIIKAILYYLEKWVNLLHSYGKRWGWINSKKRITPKKENNKEELIQFDINVSLDIDVEELTDEELEGYIENMLVDNKDEYVVQMCSSSPSLTLEECKTHYDQLIKVDPFKKRIRNFYSKLLNVDKSMIIVLEEFDIYNAVVITYDEEDLYNKMLNLLSSENDKELTKFFKLHYRMYKKNKELLDQFVQEYIEITDTLSNNSQKILFEVLHDVGYNK